MKKLILITFLGIFACSVFAKDIKQLVVTTIPPMHCQNCENKIKKGELRFIKGIKKIETNIPDQKVTIDYDADITNPEQIENAFHKIGYEVEVVTPETGTCNKTSEDCGKTSVSGSCGSGSCCKAKTE